MSTPLLRRHTSPEVSLTLLLLVALPAGISWHPYLGSYEAISMQLVLCTVVVGTALLSVAMRSRSTGGVVLSIIFALLCSQLVSGALPWIGWPMHPVAIVLGAVCNACAFSIIMVREVRLGKLQSTELIVPMMCFLLGTISGASALHFMRAEWRAHLNTNSTWNLAVAASPSGNWLADVSGPSFTLDIGSVSRHGPTLRLHRHDDEDGVVEHRGELFSERWRHEIVAIRWESEELFHVESWRVPGDARTIGGWLTRASQPWRAQHERHACRLLKLEDTGHSDEKTSRLRRLAQTYNWPGRSVMCEHVRPELWDATQPFHFR